MYRGHHNIERSWLTLTNELTPNRREMDKLNGPKFTARSIMHSRMSYSDQERLSFSQNYCFMHMSIYHILIAHRRWLRLGTGRMPSSEIRHHYSKQCQDTICKMRKRRVFVDEIYKKRCAATHLIGHIPLTGVTIRYFGWKCCLHFVLPCWEIGFLLPAHYCLE